MPSQGDRKQPICRDLSMPNMLYGALVQSPLAHARILNIDTSKAERLPGSRRCDREGGRTDQVRCQSARYDETVFGHDKVRYVGDNVAAVAAVDLETALEAASLIRVDTKNCRSVGLFEAMKEGAPDS